MIKRHICSTIVSATLLGFTGAAICIAELAHKAVESQAGSATFRSGTNVPGIEVKGSSNSLTAHADIRRNGNDLVLVRADATVPVRTLATGMKIRDEHMRKYIFETSGGQEPDLHFSADNASCPASAVSQEFACVLAGNLSIRGVARPFAVNLKVKEQPGSGSMFRVAGDGVIKLNDYGIQPPTQFGVKPSNEVSIHLDFTGKEKPAGTSDEVGGQ